MNDLQFGAFTLDRSARQLFRGDERIPLPGKAFDLLTFLARHPGQVLAKGDLLAEVWQGSFVEEANLSQTVFLIRKALGADGERILVTLPRVGYRFSEVVTERERTPLNTGLQTGAPAAGPGPAAQDVVTTTSTHSQTVYVEQAEERIAFYRSPVVLGSLALTFLLLCVASWLGWQRWEDHVGGPPVQVVVAEPDGSTGDPALDRTLATAFRMELGQSPFVTILSGANVRAKMIQMQRKPDDHLTPALAREVCERTASQAVVHSSVARAGTHYLLTEEAINCVDGASLGEASGEVSTPEKLPGALAKLAGQLRHSLGESRRTIARFSHPLAPATTSSLEALKDLTESQRLAALGRVPEAVGLLKQAVALDPNFASAWLDLSTNALNNRQNTEGRDDLTRAYNLRQYATEPTQRLIVARYNGEVTGDLYESLRNYETWTDEYPRNYIAWSGKTVVLHELGRVPEELTSAQHFLNTNSSVQNSFYSLANAQTRAGDFPAARATLQMAIVKGFDGDIIRQDLLKLGHILHDAALVTEQENWGRDHPNSPYVLGHMATYAEIEGRSDEAEQLLILALDACRHLGNDGLLNDILAEMLTDQSGLGHPEKAKQLLAQMKIDPTDSFHLYALEYAGEDARAENLLKEQLSAHPQSTTWNEMDGPTLRGKLLLDAGKPREALAALAPTRSFEADTDATYLRALANLQLKQLPEAESEFRKIIDHPGVDPVAWQRPVATLQLARTLTLVGRKAEAVQFYKAFLLSWPHADPNQPLLQSAKSELAALGTLPSER